MKEFHSKSEQETLRIARDFAKELPGGQLIGLRGELGAGKTQFAKGVISELAQVEAEEITSPTFTLVEEYRGRGPIYHVDLYRVNSAKEAGELPWDDLMAPEAITLVEWPERMEGLLSHCQTEVFLSRAAENERDIKISSKEKNDTL